MIDELNQTFIDTSKIEVSYAKDQEDPDLPRAKSRNSKRKEPTEVDKEEKQKLD